MVSGSARLLAAARLALPAKAGEQSAQITGATFFMRFHLAVLVSIVFASPALAQGTKDSSNFGAMSQPKTPTANEQSRPTVIQNVPSNLLPAGTGIQRTYRDGKLQTIVR